MSAQNAPNMEKAWDSYVEKDVLDIQVVRPEVANSWQRCRNYNVDPYGDADCDIKGLELKERIFEMQHLMNIARPFMENLYNFVKGSGFQVVLSDNQGFLLEVMGDSEIIERTQQIQLCPGGNWSELVKGTNAIGTAIVERKPVQIYAHEHYCRPNHFLTCSAAPIFDPQGELVGVLDISGDYKVANPHTLGMVVAAVNAIENQLHLHKATTKLYVAYKYSNTIIESMSDGLLSVDNSGVITQLNSRGGKILGVNPREAIGQHITTVFKATPPMLQVLQNGMGYEDREIKLDLLGKKFVSSATALRDDFGNIIGAVATMRDLQSRGLPAAPKPTLLARYNFSDIIGESEAVNEIKMWAEMAAQSNSTVLLNGESGTGKELFAQSIHNASARKEGPFLAINCAALPETLIESELFGYEEGSFTGSKKGGQPGKFELANKGTIFLDEIGDMPLNTQVKLLRVLQEKKISRVGASGEIAIDIRVIAATHRDLKSEVDKGNFREDLFYRLNVINLKIPALRERKEDIPLLARHFLRTMSARLGKSNIYLSDDFIARLISYEWPGNIRELENAIERAVNLVSSYGVMTPDLLPFNAAVPRKVSNERKVVVKPLKDVEKETIQEALKHYKGNISKVSVKLGIGRNTLYRKMKEYNIEI